MVAIFSLRESQFLEDLQFGSQASIPHFGVVSTSPSLMIQDLEVAVGIVNIIVHY